MFVYSVFWSNTQCLGKSTRNRRPSRTNLTLYTEYRNTRSLKNKRIAFKLKFQAKLFGIEAENSAELQRKELVINDLEVNYLCEFSLTKEKAFQSKLSESLSKITLLEGSFERRTECENLRAADAIDFNSVNIVKYFCLIFL